MATANKENIINMHDGHHLCWSCKEEVGEGPFCSHCVKMQPLEEINDYFALFNLKRQYNIDPNELKKPFYELSKKFHPDYYADASELERTIARDNTAYINMAFNTLSDPIKRADYLLSLTVDTAKSNPAPPQDLFNEILEVGELLMSDRLSDTNRTQLKRIDTSFKSRQDELLSAIGRLFNRLMDGNDNVATDIESHLNQIKYLRAIITRIEKRLEAEQK